MKIRLIAVVLALCISFTDNAQVPAQMIPSFTFFKLDNTAFTNHDVQKNRKLFFVFFDATCDHCHHALQYINQHFGEFNKAALYLVTLDAPPTINAVMDKYCPQLKGKAQVTILRDIRNEFIQKFGPRKYPSLFLYSLGKRLIHYTDDVKELKIIATQIKSTHNLNSR